MTLDEVLEKLQALPEKEREEVKQEATKRTAQMRFIPNPGKQTDAFLCIADILGYGGSGGSGKSLLSLGLAFERHKRALILRRHYTDLGKLIEDAVKLNGTKQGFNGSIPPKLRTVTGSLINFGGAQHLGDEMHWQGHDHDLIVPDETTQFLEQQVRFLLGWNRTDIEGQRCRAVLPSNPPLTAEGLWYINFFRPWLDDTHPNPAMEGELRWFVTDPDGKDFEVTGPEPYQFPGEAKPVIPKSRTFIFAALADNPYLIRTGYQATLDALPEPMRSAIRDGDFKSARADDGYQIIPTAWILAAQERWKPDGWKAAGMSAMAFDPAGGGKDSAELCFRHGGWYGPFISEKGDSTADPGKAFGHIMSHRRDNAPVIIDFGGGYGGPIRLRLQDNGIPHAGFNGAARSMKKIRGTNILCANKRAEALLTLKEELDPDQKGGSAIALPPDAELRADLASYRFDPRAMQVRGVLQVESKDEIKKRLGRSPGKGDACFMCLSEGNAAVARYSSSNSGAPQVNVGYANLKRRRA